MFGKPDVGFWLFEVLVNQYLRLNLGYEKYNYFNLTKFILVLLTFQLMQQPLSKTGCWMKSLESVLKLHSNSPQQKYMLQD